MMKYLAITLATLCGTALTMSLAKSKQPVEVGKVEWARDFDAALAASEKSGKPVFLLFQEVPGCAGCRKFGTDVLSHPLLVEAIEDEFVPMLVHNNKSGGEDEKVLLRFKEPAWNFQVVRFLSGAGKDLIPRKDRVWTTGALASRMVAALEAAGRDVPKYLQALAPQPKTEQVAFAMHCFWTGEYELGKIDGVVSTEAGWLEGHEVTLVEYDPDQVSFDALKTKATAAKCAQKIYPNPSRGYRAAKASDQAKQIDGHRASKIPGLTELQRTKLNAFLRSEPKKALAWLSPRQRAALAK